MTQLKAELRFLYNISQVNYIVHTEKRALDINQDIFSVVVRSSLANEVIPFLYRFILNKSKNSKQKAINEKYEKTVISPREDIIMKIFIRNSK